MPNALAPFLITLEAHGFRLGVSDYQRLALILNKHTDWTLNGLRDVLLVLLTKNELQQETFLRVFNEFFDTQNTNPDALREEVKQLDIQSLLADIKKISSKQTEKPFQKLIPERLFVKSDPQPVKINRTKQFIDNIIHFIKTNRLRWLIYPLLLIALLTTAWFVDSQQQPVIESWITNTVTLPKKIQPTKTTSTTIQSPTPTIGNIHHSPAKFPKTKQQALLQTALLWLLTFAYGIVIWRARKIPKDKKPDFNLNLPQHLALEQLGGKPAGQLDQQTLSQLADCVGYFVSDNGSKTLNIPASIAATSEAGNIPTLKFYRRKQLRQVIILQDSLSEALAWNDIALELQHGLQALGIAVLGGKFCGNPREFIDDEGRKYYLDDLDSQRHALILLIFSDGKGLQSSKDYYALEMLKAWQQCAWLELRARAFWDASTALPVHYGIPLYPANPNGLLAAFKCFLTESAPQQNAAKDSKHWRGVIAQGNKNLSYYLELLLAHALPLAQACSMIQPLSLGLIQAVRLQFFPHLPAETIESLIKIPKTTRTVTGLHFSTPVLAVLRQGFLTRFTESKQEEMLRFLLQQIKAIEPQDKQSLAYCHWSWRYHRLLLELEPDKALEQLSKLAQTPLKNAVRLDLADTACRGELIRPYSNKASLIPLRKAPTTQDGRQRLGQLARHCGIKTLEAYPIAWSKKILAGCLLLCCVVATGWAVRQLKQPDLATIQFKTTLQNFSLQLEVMQNKDWQTLQTAQYVSGLQWSVGQGKTYRLVLSSKDHKEIRELGLVNDNVELTIAGKGTETVTIIEPEMIAIPKPKDCFLMGSPASEGDRNDNEKQHQVCVEAFELGKTEVTKGQFSAFVSATGYQTEAETGDGCYSWTGKEYKKYKKYNWRNVGFTQTDEHPVVCVSWNDAMVYTAWLSKVTGKSYRLPTEAQWEYAARAGTTTAFYTGECINTTQANYDGNYDYNNCGAKTGVYKKQTVAVGSYKANPWRLSDMAGNVWEWTCSAYDSNYTGKETQCESKNDANMLRVLRGGGWSYGPRFLRVARRDWFNSDDRKFNIGFRLSRM